MTDEVSSAVVRTLRLLLRATSADDVVAAMLDVVRDLGGTVVPAASAPSDALPIDLSFGIGDPLLAVGAGPAAVRLEQLLPALAEDARIAVARVNRDEALHDSATRDPLTGLTNRRAAMRVLSRMAAGDTVVFIDLDFFKQVNDERGHDAGDDVLRAFAGALLAVARAGDTAGRLGGEEFVLLLPRTGVAGAMVVIERLREVWATARPHPVTFSAGMAAITHEGGRGALRDADRALYAAKRSGRDRVEVA